MATFVCLSGLPGTGKSTVARALAARTGALWLRVDAIEAAMWASPHAPRDLADLGYRALGAAAEGALAQGFDVIGDSVNSVAVTRALYRGVSARAGARHLDVCFVCGDPAEHRRRVETRAAEVPDLDLPDWAAVAAREWEPFADADMILDTAELSPEATAARIAARLPGAG